MPGFEDPKHDLLLAIMVWVENGTAPDEIIATTWANDDTRDEAHRKRPICKYPTRAVYSGKGDVNAAEDSLCEPPYETFAVQ